MHILLLILSLIPAHALEFKVIGRETTPLVSTQALPGDRSVGELSHEILSRYRDEHHLDYEGSVAVVSRIHHLENEVEVLSEREMKAYGWCYRVNGVAPDILPDDYRPLKDDDQLTWFYAYTLYKDGEWLKQCMPVAIP